MTLKILELFASKAKGLRTWNGNDIENNNNGIEKKREMDEANHEMRSWHDTETLLFSLVFLFFVLLFIIIRSLFLLPCEES